MIRKCIVLFQYNPLLLTFDPNQLYGVLRMRMWKHNDAHAVVQWANDWTNEHINERRMNELQNEWMNVSYIALESK